VINTSKAPWLIDWLTALHQHKTKVPWITIAISKAPALTASEPRVVVCASGCISHTWPSTAARLTPQTFVVVTQPHTNCSSFTYPGGMEARVKLDCSGDRTRTFCIHERTCVGAANASTELAKQLEMPEFNIAWIEDSSKNRSLVARLIWIISN